jgi:hypothetical protein
VAAVGGGRGCGLNRRDEGGAQGASRDSEPAGSVNNVDLGVLDVASVQEMSFPDIPCNLERGVSSRLTLRTIDRAQPDATQPHAPPFVAAVRRHPGRATRTRHASPAFA